MIKDVKSLLEVLESNEFKREMHKWVDEVPRPGIGRGHIATDDVTDILYEVARRIRERCS